jgi:hypothetical protein
VIGDLSELQRKSLSKDIILINSNDSNISVHEVLIKAIIRLSSFDMGSACLTSIFITNFISEFK